MEPPTVVIDNGTGYSKMGYAGNLDPSYIIPSTIATSLAKVSYKPINYHQAHQPTTGVPFRSIINFVV